MDSIKSLVEQSNSLLILLPSRPDFDSVAAGLSLYLSLKNKKDVTISSSEPMLVEFNRLVGVDRVTQEIGNKNLIIKFTDYKASNIEKVSYDIENGEFKLTVVPKIGNKAPDDSQLSISHSGAVCDLVILVGGEKENEFQALSSKDLENVKAVHIGTRSLSGGSGRVMSFETPASCVSESVGALIKESGFDMDADIATNLLAGIETGSEKFSSFGVSASTFQMFADLLNMGGRRDVKTIDNQDFPPGSIPGNLPDEIEQEDIPQDWVGPKVYKGTPVS